MNPEDFRQQIHQLQRAVAELQQGWCIAVCSADERLIGIVALLLEDCDWAARSIADVLELDHGWPRCQSNQWLMRMGLWEEDLPSEA